MIDYLLLDVFTDRAFTGNPLAVVVGATDLPDAAMQAVANELNLSETVFLGQPGPDGAWPTRIFTPAVELPFAGHPTVGAAVALASTGRLEDTGSPSRCVLAEEVGPIEVEVSPGPGDVWSATFGVPRTPVRVQGLEPAEAATLVQLPLSELDDGVEPAVWSAGVAFAVIAVRSVDALAVARPVPDAEHLYVLAPVDGPAPTASTWRARMFAPAMGIAEDPATGGAAAATAGLFATLDASGAAQRTWTIEQGVEMGRPSRIVVRIERGDRGELGSVFIGGSAVVVGDGRLVRP
jgi:trans-2,3-dihydro-3-hydroxyanthranilate isomerase